MVSLICTCGKNFKVSPYLAKVQKYCSYKCKGLYSDKPRMLGNTFAKGHKPWNRGIKGLRLSFKGQFKNGHTPWNRGESIILSDKNWFEKGHKPANKKPVGCKSIRIDKYGTERYWIKVEDPSKWIPYPQYIWLKAGREIPKGMVLHHINLLSNDDRLENLILITKEEHPKVHSQWKTNNISQRGV